MAASPTARVVLPWIASVLIHGLLAVGVFLMPDNAEPQRRAFELSNRKLPPPPPPPPPPPKLKLKKPVKLAMRKLPPRAARKLPPPPAEPKVTTKPKSVEPTRTPTFGIKLSGTATAAPGTGIQVPQGETLLTKPTRKPQKKKKKPGKIGKVDRPGFKTKFKTGERAPLAVVTRLPKVGKRVVPEYPDRMKELGIEGRVVLELTINASGKVIKARVVTGLHPQLDAAARAAALKMRFSPGTVNNVAVSVKIPYTFTFVLD